MKKYFYLIIFAAFIGLLSCSNEHQFDEPTNLLIHPNVTKDYIKQLAHKKDVKKLIGKTKNFEFADGTIFNFDKDKVVSYEFELEQRNISSCAGWIAYFGHDCCENYIYPSGTQCYANLTWYAKNCNGNNFQAMYWVYKWANGQPDQLVGQGYEPIEECYQSVWHTTTIPLQPGTYSLLWIIGNYDGEWCDYEYTPTFVVTGSNCQSA